MVSAGPYANLHLAQIDNHASIPPLNICTGWMPFLPPNQQHQTADDYVVACTKQVLKFLFPKSIQFFVTGLGRPPLPRYTTAFISVSGLACQSSFLCLEFADKIEKLSFIISTKSETFQSIAVACTRTGSCFNLQGGPRKMKPTTILLVTFECVGKIQRFLADVHCVQQEVVRCKF